MHLKGTGVALVTPFRKGEIDYPALTNIINHVINGGVDYVVALGSTGEAITCSSKECRRILDHTIQVVNGRVPIVAGPFGYNNTRTVVDKVSSFDFDGIDAILSSSPAYNKPSQEGIFQHYMSIAEACPVPIIIYNVPGRTASNIAYETTLRLAEASNQFVGIKEASGNLSQIMHIAKRKRNDFVLISGDDELTLPMMAAGAEGVISVIANAYPKQFSDMVNFALVGDFEMAREKHFELLDFHGPLYVEGNPVGIKALMEILKLSSKEVRLPLTSLSDTFVKELFKLNQKIASILV